MTREPPAVKIYDRLVAELGDPFDREPHYKELRPKARARRKPTTEEKPTS